MTAPNITRLCSPTDRHVPAQHRRRGDVRRLGDARPPASMLDEHRSRLTKSPGILGRWKGHVCPRNQAQEPMELSRSSARGPRGPARGSREAASRRPATRRGAPFRSASRGRIPRACRGSSLSSRPAGTPRPPPAAGSGAHAARSPLRRFGGQQGGRLQRGLPGKLDERAHVSAGILTDRSQSDGALYRACLPEQRDGDAVEILCELLELHGEATRVRLLEMSLERDGVGDRARGHRIERVPLEIVIDRLGAPGGDLDLPQRERVRRRAQTGWNSDGRAPSRNTDASDDDVVVLVQQTEEGRAPRTPGQPVENPAYDHLHAHSPQAPVKQGDGWSELIAAAVRQLSEIALLDEDVEELITG